MHSTCLAQAQLYVTPKLAMSIWRVIPLSTRLALNSPLGHFNGKSTYSPHIPDTKLTVTSKVQFLQLQHVFRQKCNPSHVQRHTQPSQPSQLLITQFGLNKHNLSTSLAAPKANPIFHAAKKNPISKNTFRLSPSYFFILLLFLTNLARGITRFSGETT